MKSKLLTDIQYSTWPDEHIHMYIILVSIFLRWITLFSNPRSAVGHKRLVFGPGFTAILAPMNLTRPYSWRSVFAVYRDVRFVATTTSMPTPYPPRSSSQRTQTMCWRAAVQQGHISIFLYSLFVLYLLFCICKNVFNIYHQTKQSTLNISSKAD